MSLPDHDISFTPPEMYTNCPACQSEEFDFHSGDLAVCFECGEFFYPDVSGSPYEGDTLDLLYHASASPPEEVLASGLRHDLNLHGWVYLSATKGRWAREGEYIYSVDVTGLSLFCDPAGFEDDYYVECSISPDRICLLQEL